MTKNTLILILAAATLTSCRGGSKNAAEGGPAPAPAPAAPATPAPQTPPPVPGEQDLKLKDQALMVGRTKVTHFRILDLKKFRQISMKSGQQNTNPDFYAVNGKIMKVQPMLAELKRGATACFTNIVGFELGKQKTLPVLSSQVRVTEGADTIHQAIIASSDKPQNAVVVLCMKSFGPVTGVGFKQSLKGIVELVSQK